MARAYPEIHRETRAREAHRSSGLRAGGFRALTILTLSWTFVLVVVGVVVRVTGSGLGCPDWPLCHGSPIPPLELPSLIEYTHRLSAALSVLLIAGTTAAAWAWYRRDRQITVLASLAAVLVVAQSLLGAI